MHLCFDKKNLQILAKIFHYFAVVADSQTLSDYSITEGTRLILVVLKKATDSTAMKSQSSNVLWDEVNNLLMKHFTADDARRVLEEFKKVNAKQTYVRVVFDIVLTCSKCRKNSILCFIPGFIYRV